MDYKLLESAEFYTKRYQNYSTLIIYPTLFFFLFIILFAAFGTKETTVKTQGELISPTTISKIYSISSQEITENRLKNNQQIEKGEKLIEYKNESSMIESEHTVQQLKEKEKQQKEVHKLIDTIEGDFSSELIEDPYGYRQILTDLQSQLFLLDQADLKEQAEIERQNTQLDEVRKSIDTEISVVENKKKLSRIKKSNNRK